MRATLIAVALLALLLPFVPGNAAAAGDDGTSFVFTDKAQVVVFTNRTIADGAPFRGIADQNDDGTVTDAERQQFEMEVARNSDQRDMAEPGLWVAGEPPRAVATSLLIMDGLAGPADAAGPIAIRSVSAAYFLAPDGATTWTFVRNHTDGDNGRHLHILAPPGYAVRDHAGLDEARVVGHDGGVEGLLVNGTHVEVTFGRPDKQAGAPMVGLAAVAIAATGAMIGRRR